ncbi:tRNA 2'-phosphotransferase 1 isoform X2 [Lepidochelys kempii]|uniref:tRNA 2'-phosphotransferase 1 isoform X2 n=1 Tax=Lepidochelys kempii TaxID=8472 RepID=UPI003C6F7746
MSVCPKPCPMFCVMEQPSWGWRWVLVSAPILPCICSPWPCRQASEQHLSHKERATEPQQKGLRQGTLCLDGFLDVAALLSLPRFGGVSVADVRHVVETNEKRRFALRPHPSDGRLQIRANQGHSLQVSELELIPLLEPTALPQTIAHGTYLRHWPAICRGGLSRMGRNHIHLAPGLPGDGHVLSGMRQDCDVAIVIDGPQALADGIQFYRSANGVILTPGDAEGLLPPQYFQRVLQLRPDRRLLPLE